MKRRLVTLTTVLVVLTGLLLVLPPSIWTQVGTIYTNQISPGTTSQPVGIGPSSTSGCFVNSTTGELSCTQPHTDGYAFLPAYAEVTCTDLGGANIYRASRAASNDWFLSHPNGMFGGAVTLNCSLNLNNWLQRVGGVKGVKITSIDLVYQITGVALTSHNLACQLAGAVCLGGVATTVYANNAANVVGNFTQTATALATATQTNPYLTNIPITAPAFVPANIRTGLTMEWQAVGAAAGIYRVYGAGVNFQVLAE